MHSNVSPFVRVSDIFKSVIHLMKFIVIPIHSLCLEETSLNKASNPTYSCNVFAHNFNLHGNTTPGVIISGGIKHMLVGY